MRDEIAHMRVVHGALRLCPPGVERGLIVGVDADNMDIVNVLKYRFGGIHQFAAKDEMQALGHAGAPKLCVSGATYACCAAASRL